LQSVNERCRISTQDKFQQVGYYQKPKLYSITNKIWSPARDLDNNSENSENGGSRGSVPSLVEESVNGDSCASGAPGPVSRRRLRNEECEIQTDSSEVSSRISESTFHNHLKVDPLRSSGKTAKTGLMMYRSRSDSEV